MKFAGRIALAGLVLVVATVGVWEFRWLAVVTARKVSGNLPGVEWRELPAILRFNGGVSLHRLAASGNPNAAIENPFTSPSDRAHGRVLFEGICAKCHGPGAGGGMGPPLVGRSLTHGDSDWSMYRTITHGVPNTAMQPGFVGRHDA
jgi:mono/diheme cytochrome c family protein